MNPDFFWLIWPFTYLILMILTTTKYHENLHRDSPLSLLSIVKYFFSLETKMNLKIRNETFLRITQYYQNYIYIYMCEYESYITVSFKCSHPFYFLRKLHKIVPFHFFDIINIKKIILQQSLVHNSAVKNCLLRVMESWLRVSPQRHFFRGIWKRTSWYSFLNSVEKCRWKTKMDVKVLK